MIFSICNCIMDISKRANIVLGGLANDDSYGDSEHEEDRHKVNHKQDKSCKTVTLTCWLALLTCVVLLCQNMLSMLSDLSNNEQFWHSTQQFIALFEKMNVTMLCKNTTVL